MKLFPSSFSLLCRKVSHFFAVSLVIHLRQRPRHCAKLISSPDEHPDPLKPRWTIIRFYYRSCTHTKEKNQIHNDCLLFLVLFPWPPRLLARAWLRHNFQMHRKWTITFFKNRSLALLLCLFLIKKKPMHSQINEIGNIINSINISQKETISMKKKRSVCLWLSDYLLCTLKTSILSDFLLQQKHDL